MTPAPTATRRRLLALAVVPALLVVSCGSEPRDDSPIQAPDDGGQDPSNPDSVVPPDENGVGGGAPIDNLDPAQSEDDTNGDGEPG